MDNRSTGPHRRLNALTGDWVLVSPHRTDRPWLGERIETQAPAVPAYDPTCYLCPGNERANGVRNPHYESTYVFTNDFPALLPDAQNDTVLQPHAGTGLLVARPERGECRVVCFSPRHDLHLGALTEDQAAAVVETWAAQYRELGGRDYVNAVTIFENRGAMMGASNPHPHAQIWAESSLPNELAKETQSQRQYFETGSKCLLCEYVREELESGERVVHADERIAVLVPFWVVWPFETMVVGRAHRGSLDAYDEAERRALARAMQDLVRRYDRLFGVPFPYSMGFHQRPTDSAPHEEWHVHAHYYPPLLRSATVRKYMVGYEMLAQPQRDITAERAAEVLRGA